jgi:signal transduction histidine kinase
VSRLSRLPVRVRVTLAFAAGMALVLGATGLFLYVRLGSDLNATIDQGLRSRADDIEAEVQSDPAVGRGGGPVIASGETLTQLLDRSGTIVDATPRLGDRQVLDAAQLRRALRHPIVFERRIRFRSRVENARFLAQPAPTRRGRLIVVVGSSLNARTNALDHLKNLLLIGLPGALLFASLAGYAATAAALRPVERMRRRAAEIQAADPGHRLPVPPAHDEIGRLGETLNTMLDRLEDAFERERRLVSDASHELRTPIAILKSELELALRAGRTPDELQEALISATEEADRLTQLTEDLLVIAASDQGQLPVQISDVPAAEILEGVQARFERRAQDRGAEIAVSAPDGLILAADPLRLEQALGNLLDNALRYGGRRIELVATDDGVAAELHVLDNGPGFPEEFVAHAFERFTRADVARGRSGAGLGLSIVDAIAAAQGGAARARNRSRGGADVSLTVPRARRMPRPAAS